MWVQCSGHQEIIDLRHDLLLRAKSARRSARFRGIWRTLRGVFLQSIIPMPLVKRDLLEHVLPVITRILTVPEWPMTRALRPPASHEKSGLTHKATTADGSARCRATWSGNTSWCYPTIVTRPTAPRTANRTCSSRVGQAGFQARDWCPCGRLMAPAMSRDPKPTLTQKRIDYAPIHFPVDEPA